MNLLVSDGDELLGVFVVVIICIDILFLVGFIVCFWIGIVLRFWVYCVMGMFVCCVFFWGDKVLFFFFFMIGLCWGVWGDGLFFNFWVRIGEEWGFNVFCMEVEGGEGGKGLREIGYFFWGVIGDMLGLLWV